MSLDDAAVKAMPGVVAVVRDGSFLAVAAEREEQAIKAREALRSAAVLDAALICRRRSPTLSTGRSRGCRRGTAS